MAKRVKRKRIKKIECPDCSLEAKIDIKKYCKFVIYVCPQCKSNIAIYGDDKISIISDQMVSSLKKQKKLEVCGDVLFPVVQKEKREITKDAILNLRILLETEKDFNKILKQL